LTEVWLLSLRKYLKKCLTIGPVAFCLSKTVENDKTVLHDVSVQLGLWESQPGFCSVLLELVDDKSNSVVVRNAAVILLKNVIEKYWRRSDRSYYITDDEKVYLRSRLLSLFNESASSVCSAAVDVHLMTAFTLQVAKTHAVLLSTVAMHDYPSHWPSMLSDIIAGVASAGAEAASRMAAGDVGGAEVANLVQVRAAVALQAIVKSLCSRAAGIARRTLSSVAAALLALASQLVVHCGSVVAADVTQRHVPPDERALVLYEVGIKLARRLLKYILPDVNAASGVLSDDLPRVAGTIAVLPTLRASASQAVYASALRLVALSLKLMAECCEQRGGEFAALAAPYVPLCAGLLQSEVASASDAESRPSVLALRLLNTVVDQAALRNSPELAPLLSVESLAALVELLVTRHFALRDAELALWRDEPETFFAEQDVDGVLTTPRAHARLLTVTCLRNVPALAQPVAHALLRLVDEADEMRTRAASSAGAFEAARRLDACYSLAGAAAFDLHDHIDFGGWFERRLARVLVGASADAADALVQHRVLWLLCEWINDVAPATRAPLCRSLAALIAADNVDLVVRLTAANTLHHCTCVVEAVTYLLIRMCD
jgi:hypothetical protein